MEIKGFKINKWETEIANEFRRPQHPTEGRNSSTQSVINYPREQEEHWFSSSWILKNA